MSKGERLMLKIMLIGLLVMFTISATIAYADYQRITKGEPVSKYKIEFPSVLLELTAYQRDNANLYEKILQFNGQEIEMTKMNDLLYAFFVFIIGHFLLVPVFFMWGFTVFCWNYLSYLAFGLFPTAIKDLTL